MKNYKVSFALVLLTINALVEFYAEFVVNIPLITITKPFLLPSLMLYFVLSLNGKWSLVSKLVLCALFFSWIGDVSLMLTPESETDFSAIGIPKSKYFFLLGLSAFLINHLFLISAYRKSWNGSSETFFQTKKIYFIPFIVFWLIMIAVIVLPLYVNTEKSAASVPVILYAAVISSMAAFALNRYGFISNKSFWLVFIGALLFVFSDVMIALNFLAFPGILPKPGFVIITTYFVAEFLITQGMLKQEESK